MGSPRSLLIALGATVAALGLMPVAAASIAGAARTTTTTTPPLVTTTTTYTPSSPYTPVAPNGGTDDYHCTVIDPHITQSQYIVSSQLLPDQTRTDGQSNEVHHAIYFLVSGASNVARANQLNVGGGGWTCFGAPLNPSGSFDGTTWLGGWAPGRGVNTTPPGTGVPLPANSLIVLQMHYNLLKGSHPDLSSLRLVTAPQATSELQPLSLDPNHIATPDIPCVKGTDLAAHPLCDRAASLADLGARFGPSAVNFVNTHEGWCHGGDPGGAAGAIARIKQPAFGAIVKTVCTTPLTEAPGSVIRQVTPHLHLTGWAVKVQLVSGGKTTTLVNQPSYNFDGQVSYALPKPVTIKAGDAIKMTCTYNPSVRSGLGLQTRYVTWGDGSSDEMCLGIIGTTPH